MPSAVIRFDARIKIEGVNPYVDVPRDVSDRLEGRSNAAVLIRVRREGGPPPRATGRAARDSERLMKIRRLTADGWFRTSLVPTRGGPRRLYLDLWMRDSAGAGVGDLVEVSMRPDVEPRRVPMPKALRDALAKSPEATKAWEALSPSRQKADLSYLNFLKSPEALARNVQKLVRNLERGTGGGPAHRKHGD